MEDGEIIDDNIEGKQDDNGDHEADNIEGKQDDMLIMRLIILKEKQDDNVDHEAPMVGMTFGDREEMFNFYKAYSKWLGFGVKKRSNRKDDEGVLRWTTFTCTKAGKPVSKRKNALKPQPSSRTDCKAQLSASLDIDGRWRINSINLVHNHVILSPSQSRFISCHRYISAPAKRRLEVNDQAGIKGSKSYNSLVVEEGGHENLPFLKKDTLNYIRKARNLQLGEGDALDVQKYFTKMQSLNSDFFYSMDLDDDGRLRKMFWADPRSREAYKKFGEVVTFDTTYLTNRYAMPFAPFVGVNHHGESILLGCVLISSEDKDTFVWLFETWLTCMHGKAPEGIITDQDQAMKNTIEIVFLGAKHRWCLWHVMKKLPEKFKSYKRYEAISLDMLSVVYDSQSPEEFERDWCVFLEEYKLHENEWLTSLYEGRNLWVPCFVKSHFWAGMSTTQRSESINAFFKDYVTSKTTLKQFVAQYEQATNDKVEKECQSDFKSHNEMLSIVTTYEYEVQVRKVYTTSKFKEFQDELTGMMYCIFMSSQENENISTYGIREDIVVGEGKKENDVYSIIQES